MTYNRSFIQTTNDTSGSICEIPLTVAVKTCGCKEKNTIKVTYTFIDAIMASLIKKILTELGSGGRLLKDTTKDEIDKKAI